MKHPARNDGKMNIIREINRTGKRGEMLRFVLVGGFCTLLQYGFYVLFVHVAGISVLASTVISYLLSLVANFFYPVCSHSDQGQLCGMAWVKSLFKTNVNKK